MSTRGFIGFRKNNEVKGWYNHYDSYYGGRGLDILNKYKKHNNVDLNNFYNKINFIEEDDDDLYYKNSQNILDWEWNNVENITLQNSVEFLNDGLFCEYAYIFNLDNDTVEVYRGFFSNPSKNNQQGYNSNGTVYYVNKVLNITRSNDDLIKYLFENENELYKEDVAYWEREYLENNKNNYVI